MKNKKLGDRFFICKNMGAGAGNSRQTGNRPASTFILYDELQKLWEMFLKKLYPKFVVKEITNYFNVQDISYYPKPKYKNRLNEIFYNHLRTKYTHIKINDKLVKI